MEGLGGKRVPDYVDAGFYSCEAGIKIHESPWLFYVCSARDEPEGMDVVRVF